MVKEETVKSLVHQTHSGEVDDMIWYCNTATVQTNVNLNIMRYKGAI